MDITQTLITAGAIIGIIVVALLAIIPTLLEFPSVMDTSHPKQQAKPKHDVPRSHVDLAA